MSKPMSWQAWIKAAVKDPDSPINLPRVKHVLAPLTGQDTRALTAFVTCLELYATGDEDSRRGGFAGMRAVLPALQRECWPFARELIPFVLDWHDRARLWPLLIEGLPDRPRSVLADEAFAPFTDWRRECRDTSEFVEPANFKTVDGR